MVTSSNLGWCSLQETIASFPGRQLSDVEKVNIGKAVEIDKRGFQRVRQLGRTL
jgi:hypothetical protein